MARSSLRDPFVGHRCTARKVITAQYIWTSREKAYSCQTLNDTNDPNHWERRKADCALPERRSNGYTDMAV